MPAYNEDNTIIKAIELVLGAKLPSGVTKELIIIDDGSSDSTLQKIMDFKSRHKNIKIIRHEKNMGKGAGVRTGLQHASGEIIIIQDADLEYNPDDYSKLIEPILKNRAKVVYGSRFLKAGFISHQKWAMPLHYLGNIFLSLVTSLLYGCYISDMETCYKVFKKDVLKHIEIKSSRFDFEPEITAKILRKKIKILEIPIKYNSRGYKEGKKVGWKDGFAAIWVLIKYRFCNC